MSNEYFVNKNDMVSVADMIRVKTKSTNNLQFPTEWIDKIKNIGSPLSTFEKVGTMVVGYTKTTLDIKTLSNWQNVTLADIYFVPIDFSITATGNTTAGTYNINKTYSNGVITAWRDSIPGTVGITFTCEVYVYMKHENVGRIYKIGENQPLTFGVGISINISSIAENYQLLTVDNFYLDLKKIDVNVTVTGGGSANIIKSYDATNGVFNFSRASIPFSGSMNNYCDVYVYVPY